MAYTPITSASPNRDLQASPPPAAAQGLRGQAQAVERRGEVGPREAAQQQLNVQILQASAEVSLKGGDESQALLFRAAIDRINELLEPTLGVDALQGKLSEDNSPEATAERILSLSTGFFDAYAAQRPDDDPEQVVRDFVDLIRGGFEQGFNEAKEILQGLKVFGGDIESGIMKTFELVQKGYDDFLAARLAPPDAQPADEGEGEGTTTTPPVAG